MFEIRTITDDEVPTFRDVVMTGFGDETESDPDGAQRMRALVPTSQCWAAFDGGTIVATAATLDHSVVVPGGGTLAMAGLTMVTVRPTHRRRGVLRALMGRHLDDARARGIPTSGLWSSEAAIYGRFGYGLAAEGDVLEVTDARLVDLGPARELDELEWIDEARAREALPGVFARALAARPGALVRSATWWKERRFLESPFMRDGASRRRHVLARRGAELVGYIAFRQRGGWTDGLPAGKLEIIEIVGIDARAEATLWRLALRVDLFPTVIWGNAPTDDALAWTVANPRQIKRRRADTLWLRIEDVATALMARTYAADGELRFSVDERSWHMVVEHGRAVRCAEAGDGADLAMSRAALGALYLGGVLASRLARADVIAGGPAALALADRMFASPRAPWCPDLF